jgi:hypothetical protein
MIVLLPLLVGIASAMLGVVVVVLYMAQDLANQPNPGKALAGLGLMSLAAEGGLARALFNCVKAMRVHYSLRD